jgi:uncharacterized protein YjbJ (UPF0337 family)
MMAGMKERIAGKVMQWEGKATGDPIRQAEGKALSTFGRLKDKKAIATAIAVGLIITVAVLAAQQRERANPAT